MSKVTVSSKYQIVIPLAIRRQLDIKKGQKLHIVVKDHSINLLPDYPLIQMKGYLRGMSQSIERDEEDRQRCYSKMN
jgi:AbrB family looped-hinge helix DNA binding protein